MLDVLSKWESGAEKKPVCFIVKGAGEKAFCAGGDVVSIWKDISDGSLAKEDIGVGKKGTVHSDFFRTEYHMNYALGKCSIPQISLWNGFVMGGGVGVSVLGRYRVATDTTVFSMPETAIGLFPDVGSSSWLPHIQPSGFGMYVGLTGQRLYAYDLIQSGIATHYVPKDDIPALEAALSNATNENDILTILNNASSKAAPDDSKSVLKNNKDIIEKIFAPGASLNDINIELNNEINKGVNESEYVEWATKTLKTLNKMSPTSVAITHELLHRGVGLDLKDCLLMEYRVVNRCMSNDFQEGIRALLVDKDNNPTWKPKPTSSEVEHFFSPLPEENDITL